MAVFDDQDGCFSHHRDTTAPFFFLCYRHNYFFLVRGALPRVSGGQDLYVARGVDGAWPKKFWARVNYLANMISMRFGASSHGNWPKAMQETNAWYSWHLLLTYTLAVPFRNRRMINAMDPSRATEEEELGAVRRVCCEIRGRRWKNFSARARWVWCGQGAAAVSQEKREPAR